MARGVYFRTEKDGTPLATPELRISATNNRTVYYDDATARDAAMQAGEIKEGSIVLTGYADGEAEILMKQEPDWENAVTITAAQINAGYTVPADGMIVGYLICSDTSVGYHTVTVNGVVISNAYFSNTASDYSFSSIDVTVKKGDVFKSTNIRNDIDCSFVPFKTVAEPLTLPVNILNNPSLPDYSRAITTTAAQLQTGYTAPANGIICISGHPASDARGYVAINGVVVASGYASSTGGYRECQVQIPVSKNDIIRTVDGNNNGQLWLLHAVPVFVPFKS